MAEQSGPVSATSPGTMCRALVMLVCLIGLPLAALRGTAWSDLTATIPDIVKKILDGRWGSSSALAKDTRPEAPFLRPANQAEPRSVQPRTASSSIQKDDADWSHRAGTSAAEIRRPTPVTIPKDSLKDPRPGEEAADAEGPQLHAGLRARDSETAEIRRTTLVPVARRERARGNTPGTEPPPLQNAVIRPGVGPRQTDGTGDRLNYVLDRLRALGAVYYLLETWGSDGQRFRFHCKMALGGNPAYTRHFEAIDRDAIPAMARVLAEVETWQAERERP